MTKLLNNRYHIIQVIGAGGFGETFLVEDTHMPSRRRCVMKQLKPVTNEPQVYQLVQQRFQREAAILEYLGEGSEQIPNLYAYFSENGQFYLVQEWIHGQTLAKIVQTQGTLSETTVREILVSLLPILDYVHSKGIIHRDIKPENIIQRARDGKPVLIDFGAVKETMVSMVHSPSYNSLSNSQSIVIGTPGFMPSEQAAGRPIYASDIYSLGLTAIYLLTGKQPSELPANPQTGELLWLQYTRGVSPSLAVVLNRAIQPYASARYISASEMLQALSFGYSSAYAPTCPPGTQPTVNLSPAIPVTQKPQPKPQPQPSSLNSPYIPAPETQNTWYHSGAISGAIALGLVSVVAIAGLTHKSTPEPAITASPTPKTTIVASPEPTTTPESSPPPPTPIDTPVAAERHSATVTSPPPQVDKTPVAVDIVPPSVAEVPPPEMALTLPEASPPPEVSTPPPEMAPTVPETSPPPEEPRAPETENYNPTPDRSTNSSVPAFPTGTAESTIRAKLGTPAKISRGLWNTRAYLYNFEPNTIDLGYLFDRNTRLLRQTEVAFAPSIEPEVMQNTLQQILNGQITGEIYQKLQKVYERQANQYSFKVGSLEGVIQRNNRDHIYIGVWDADLH
jgi:serine/threonine-protein kinase